METGEFAQYQEFFLSEKKTKEIQKKRAKIKVKFKRKDSSLAMAVSSNASRAQLRHASTSSAPTTSTVEKCFFAFYINFFFSVFLLVCFHLFLIEFASTTPFSATENSSSNVVARRRDRPPVVDFQIKVTQNTKMGGEHINKMVSTKKERKERKLCVCKCVQSRENQRK